MRLFPDLGIRDPRLQEEKRAELRQGQRDVAAEIYPAVSNAVMEGVFEEIDAAGQDVSNIAANQGVLPAAAHGLIRGVGTAGMMAGNVLETPFDLAASGISAIAPDSLKKEYNALMGSISKGVTDSESFKWAMKEAEKDPQKAKELVSMLRTMDVTGIRHMGGPVVNDLLENVITKLEGFYDGPTGAVTAFGREGAKAVPNTVKGQFSAQELANTRALGTGPTRRNEAVNARTGSERQGNKFASSFIRKQIDNRLDDETIADMLPSIQVGTYGATRWGDKQGVRNLLTMDGQQDVPDGVVDHFINSTGRGLIGSTNWKNPMSIIKNEVIPRATNFRNKVDDTILNVRNPNGKVDNLAEEALGKSSTTSVVQRGLRSGQYEKFLKRTGFPDDFQAFTDYIKLGHALEKPGWAKIPDSVKGDDKQSALMNKYITAKYNTEPSKWTKEQKELVSAIDNNILDANIEGQGWIDKENQTIKYATTYLSSAKDLGGVGFRGVYDYGNKKSYSSVIDGHDMFGTNPAGGVGLWNSTPIMTANLTGTTALPKRSTADTQKLEDATRALEEKTGMLRIPKESAVEYKERVGANPGESVKDAEARTGIKQRTTDESPGMFESRVMKDYVAPVGMMDRANVAKNYGLLGSSIADLETTAGGLPPYLLNQQAQGSFDALKGLIGEVTGQSAEQLLINEEPT